MTVLSDLQDAANAAVAESETFQAAVTQALTDLAAEVANLQAAGVDTAALEAVTAQLQTLSSGETTAQAAVAAADPGAQPAAS